MTPTYLDRRLFVAAMLAPVAVGCAPAAGRTAAALPDDMVLGNRSAKSSLVEYASVGCPVCGQWAREVYPTIKAKYIDTGRISFTYREMLVGSGVEMTSGAAGFVLARCAGDKKYFAVIESIYRNQDKLFQVPRETLLEIARSCGMTDAEFNGCIANDAAYTALNARVERNSKLGDVSATPTFVINGRKLDAGFQPLQAIEAALQKA